MTNRRAGRRFACSTDLQATSSVARSCRVGRRAPKSGARIATWIGRKNNSSTAARYPSESVTKEICHTTRSGSQTTASARSHRGMTATTGRKADTAELSTRRRVLVTAFRPASCQRYGQDRRGRTYTTSGHISLSASVKLWSHAADIHVWRWRGVTCRFHVVRRGPKGWSIVGDVRDISQRRVG